MKKLIPAAVFLSVFAASSPAFALMRHVSGLLQYEKRTPNGVLIEKRPVRFVTVTLRNGYTTIATATTNKYGKYNAYVDATLLPAGAPLYLVFQAETATAKVWLDLDLQNESKTWTKGVTVVGSDTPVVFDVTVTKSEMSNHFNILESLEYGRQYAKDRRDPAGADIAQVEVEHPESMDAAGHYDKLWGEIEIAGPPYGSYGGTQWIGNDQAAVDEVVLHEYGHYLQDEISVAGEWMNGSDHGAACFAESLMFGWKEGWPEYFGEAVRDYYPTKIASDGEGYEQNPYCASAAAEDVVQAVLWDVHDGISATEPHDRIDGGKLYGTEWGNRLIFKIFDKNFESAFEPSILTFHDGWVLRKLYPGSHADLDRIYVEHRVYPHVFSDYSVPSVSVGNSYMAGQSAVVYFTLKNTGTTYSDEGVKVQIYIHPPQPDKIKLAEWDIPAFTGTTYHQRTVVFPANLPPGVHPFGVVVDPYDRLPEHNGTNWQENNNAYIKGLTIAVCGDDVCDYPENCSVCAADCGSCCGDNYCNYSETCATCATDCGACSGCGDGVCEPSEQGSCGADCPDCYSDCFAGCIEENTPSYCSSLCGNLCD